MHEHNCFKAGDTDGLNPQLCNVAHRGSGRLQFLWFDQALEVLNAAESPQERLVIRYFLFNGLSPMELSNARIEHLDPISCTLFLPRRHWKNNCTADIDAETVRLQAVYSGDRKTGPLILVRGNKNPKHTTLWKLVKTVAARTSIPGKKHISPIVLKRTFARMWMLSGGNVGSLQRQFSHKHLWSTARYLRFVMEDVKPNHRRMMRRVRRAIER